jgi:microcystin-dependent protein
VSDAYLGQILTTPYNFTPRNWSPCNGQSLPVAQNSALFSLIGVQFGGNPQTAFQLPNLTGRIAVGAFQAGGPAVPAGVGTYNLGAIGGSTLLPAHSHPLTNAGTATGTTTININGPASLNGTLNGTFTIRDAPSTSPTPAQGAAPQPFTLGKVNPATINIYAATNAGNAVQLSGVSVTGTVSGTLNTSAAANLTLPLAGNTGSAGDAGSTNNMPPYLALNQIICTSGLYPERP